MLKMGIQVYPLKSKYLEHNFRHLNHNHICFI